MHDSGSHVICEVVLTLKMLMFDSSSPGCGARVLYQIDVPDREHDTDWGWGQLGK